MMMMNLSCFPSSSSFLIFWTSLLFFLSCEISENFQENDQALLLTGQFKCKHKENYGMKYTFFFFSFFFFSFFLSGPSPSPPVLLRLDSCDRYPEESELRTETFGVKKFYKRVMHVLVSLETYSSEGDGERAHTPGIPSIPIRSLSLRLCSINSSSWDVWWPWEEWWPSRRCWCLLLLPLLW